jgi:hypothetical protein
MIDGHNKYLYPMNSAECCGTKEMVMKNAKLFFENGWDVVVIKGEVYSMWATINVPIGGSNGITPLSSPNLFLKMGSYTEV